jgi:hypothetical protein
VLTVVVCVVVVSFAAVTELILRCKTTEGVVEKRFEHDDDVVEVSRRFLPIAQLSYIV